MFISRRLVEQKLKYDIKYEIIRHKLWILWNQRHNCANLCSILINASCSEAKYIKVFYTLLRQKVNFIYKHVSVRLSVCLSVCLSPLSRYWIKCNWFHTNTDTHIRHSFKSKPSIITNKKPTINIDSKYGSHTTTPPPFYEKDAVFFF